MFSNAFQRNFAGLGQHRQGMGSSADAASALARFTAISAKPSRRLLLHVDQLTPLTLLTIDVTRIWTLQVKGCRREELLV